MATAAEVIGTARLIVRAQAPYFRAALLALILVEVPGLGTIGVTKNGVLMVDNEFVVKQTPKQMAGGLVHELLHLLNKHAERCGTRDHEQFNIAGDLSINTIVIEMGFELPAGALFPKAYGFPDGRTADEYYSLLEQKKDEQKKQGGKRGNGEPQQGAGAQPGIGSGKCSSCSGHAHEAEAGEHAAEIADGRTEAQMARMERQVAEDVKETIKNRGNVPGALARWAAVMTAPPQVPWQQKLARIIRASVSYRAGAVVNRYDGPSRRQAGLGYGSGIPVLPRLRQPVPHVAILTDTSGSMTEQDMSTGLREANGVLKAVGADVTFMVCDSKVHGVKKCGSVADMAKMLKGGGGSDFRPAFAELARQRPRPEIVIAVTDGYIQVPSACPIGTNVIWLLIGGEKSPCAWGESIVLKS